MRSPTVLSLQRLPNAEDIAHDVQILKIVGVTLNNHARGASVSSRAVKNHHHTPRIELAYLAALLGEFCMELGAVRTKCLAAFATPLIRPKSAYVCSR